MVATPRRVSAGTDADHHQGDGDQEDHFGFGVVDAADTVGVAEPDARYASFASYDASLSSFTGPDGSPSVLTDHRIVPDLGSHNPCGTRRCATTCGGAQGEVVANPMPDGTVDTGCRTDSDTRLAADGTYTYVVGTEEQRTTVESVPGVTFLPLSAATPEDKHLLILRNMLADPDFAEAIQRVPVGSDPARTAEVMGDHYPRTAYCDLASLTASGPQACPVV